MARQNRVSPLGTLLATPERGLVYGNRGCLHDRDGRIRRDYNGKRWIACRLEFRGRRRAQLMAPGRYTELFFLDEVTALAAGHRPCAECRRADYERFGETWAKLHGGPGGADTIDARLHAERIDPATRSRRLHTAAFEELPDGAIVLDRGAPRLVLDGHLLTWSPAGYATSVPRPAGSDATVVTPPSLLALLRAGWAPVVPLIHPSGRSLTAALGQACATSTGSAASPSTTVRGVVAASTHVRP